MSRWRASFFSKILSSKQVEAVLSVQHRVWTPCGGRPYFPSRDYGTSRDPTTRVSFFILNVMCTVSTIILKFKE